MCLGQLTLSDSIDDVFSQTFDFLVKAGCGTPYHGPNPLLSSNLNRYGTMSKVQYVPYRSLPYLPIPLLEPSLSIHAFTIVISMPDME